VTDEARVAVPFLSLASPGVPASVGEIRRNVRAFASEHGAEGLALIAIELAVSEAMANAVVHGGVGTVRVEADIEDGELEIVVLDDGPGFTGEPAPGLGMGLALMREGAASFEVRDRPEGGVEVWMRFSLES
jgi:anti-sigma regulatory factor (Ser/Thr protein kinase)